MGNIDDKADLDEHKDIDDMTRTVANRNFVRRTGMLSMYNNDVRDQTFIHLQENLMPYDFVQPNDASRERLEAFFHTLSAEDFYQTNPHGWTVAALLGHLAFWDRRMLVLLRRWQERGVDESPVDPDMINDSLQAICLALEPRVAADLCLASAKETDAALAAISPELYQAIQASPNHYRFNRSLHRDDHMNEIKRILGR